jgi:ribosome maturation factor RimP
MSRENDEGAEMDVHTKERQLEQQLTGRIEQRVPGTEVLAVELLGPERFCVYIDHPQGVDHALCERVTRELDDYRREYTIDVSSPGPERPVRKPAHFADAVGRRVKLRTSDNIGGRKKFRGEVIAADEQTVRVGAEGGDAVLIPYEQIVRGNLIDEGSK